MRNGFPTAFGMEIKSMSKSKIIALFLLCGTLLCTFPVLAQPPPPITAPGQPVGGPGGSTYPFAGVTTNGPYWANNRTTNNNLQYYIYEPNTPTPTQAPVILFLHGYAAFLPSNYQAWINHMCKKGYIVVWAKYQASATSPFSGYPANAQAAWTDALYRLQNYWWEHHVQPQQNDGVIETVIVGHSFGGWITAWLAGAQPASTPHFPPPLGLVMIEPASLGLLPAINFAGIPATEKMLILSADQDTIACSQDAVNIFESTTQVPAAQKNFLWFNSDSTGTPNQIGNHYFPNTTGYDDTAAIDTRDFYVTWKLSVGAANCLTAGTNCDYFLGNGAADQLGMGTWSNGQPVKVMSYYADPTTLPPITGCTTGKNK
jgi:pimeloyl-ACP methyl ester carboxylesterase